MSGQPAHAGGWCSLRLRFGADELLLLRTAERLHGSELARQPRPDALREALALARAGSKLAGAEPGEAISLSEAELATLVAAARYAADEVRWLGELGGEPGPDDRLGAERRERVLQVLPDLAGQGAWRAFGLSRSLEFVAQRLSQPIGR